MKSQYGRKILWIIFVLGVLTVLASCASRPQVRVLRSSTMDKQAQKICGQYDQMFVETVRSNWWNLLNSKPTAYDHARGQVILTFSLHPNGQVADMKITKRSTSISNANVCEKAVLNGVPYLSWSPEILKALRTNYCDVKFTFDYY